MIEFSLKRQEAHFATHDRFGYLTANPVHVGSGMSLCILFNLPQLTSEGRDLKHLFKF